MARGVSDMRLRASATSLATKLPAAIVAISLFSLLAAIFVAVRTGRDLSQDLTDDQIVALQGSATFDVAAELDGLVRTAQALAASPQATDAVEAFSNGLDELDRTPIADLTEEAGAVVAHHQSTYVEPLRAAGRDIGLRDISTANSATIYLQYHYAVDLGVFDRPESIDDSGDLSAWSETHSAVHPMYREVVERRDLVDLYLVDADTARVVYSVRKRPGLGTSLTVGPFSGSILAQVARSVVDDPSRGVVIGDLAFYDPALLTPVGVVASAIMDGDDVTGVLLLMYDSSIFTDRLTGGGEWDDAGFPESGQTHLIGRDGLVRSELRSFIESPQDHVASASAAGLLDESTRTKVEASGSTVLLQRANDATVLAARSGDRSIERRSNTVGINTFSSVAAVPVDDIDWFVVSEVEVAAAQGDLDDFEELLVVGTAIFIVALAFLAVAWASRLVLPVRTISERLATRADTGPLEVPTRSPIEFHRLADSFESMSAVLQSRRDQLAQAREARLDVLRSVLPPGVAGRLADGELESLDEIPMATVTVLVVVGLGRSADSAEADQRRLQEVLEELDALADHHGLERVKVLGDAYFAACGHDRPLIDHAPRAAAFALAARRAITDHGLGARGELDLAVGIHTGPVTVGTTGGHRLLYDVWGETVTTAHSLARQAHRGQILASPETEAMLPDNLATVPTDTVAGSPWLIDDAPVEPVR